MDHIAPPAALDQQFMRPDMSPGGMKGKGLHQGADKGWGPGPGLEDWLKGKGFGKPAVPLPGGTAELHSAESSTEPQQKP